MSVTSEHVLNVIKKRREPASFTNTPLTADERRAIVEAAYYSVTGNNIPSREFVIVQDKSSLDSLSRATPFMPWLASAALAVVIVGKPKASKYWLQDASIAASNIWLVAVDLGLGAAWGAIHHSEDAAECARREHIVRTVINTPEDWRPVAIMGIGHPAEPPKPKQMVPMETVVHYGRYEITAQQRQ